MQTLWQPVRIERVTPGATYQEQVFDQFLQLKAGEQVFEVFDMTPMLAVGVSPTSSGTALLSLDPHTGLSLGKRGLEQAELAALDVPVAAADAAGARPEFASRRWSVILLLPARVPVLVAPDRLASLGALAPGAVLSWRAGSTVLAGWRP
jgi:hypothetical protein